VDAAELALELTPWVDLPTAFELARAKQAGDDIERPAELVLAAPELSSGKDGGLVDLVEEYVTHFRLPDSWLASVRGLVRDGAIDESTWEWLAGLRWKGTIETDIDVEGYWVPRAQVLLKGPQAVMALLERPVTMLLHCVVLVYPQWRDMYELLGSEGLYIKPSLDGPLAVHIDDRVAKSVGLDEGIRTGRLSTRVVAGFRYQAVSGSAEELRTGSLAKVARTLAMGQHKGRDGPS